MTRITEEKGSIEAAYLGLPLSDNARMDFVALSYQPFDGKKQLSVYMSCEDFYGAAIPLVELIKYAMTHHPELLDEAAKALENPPEQPSIVTLLTELPTLPGFEKLGAEIAGLPYPLSQDERRQRVLLEHWSVRDALNSTGWDHNYLTYLAVIPTEAEVDQPVVLEAWGRGLDPTAYKKLSFDELLPGVKEMVRNEVVKAAQRAGKTS
jgi:hypothetical protein